MTAHNLGGVAFIAASSVLWLNASPFYEAKLKNQEKVLDVLYHKVGTSMRLLNNAIPRMRTSTELDRRTRKLYNQRND